MTDISKSAEYICEHRGETINNLIKFLPTDTILFWSENTELNALQQKKWQPLLDILNKTYNLNLKFTTGLTADKNESNCRVFKKMLENLSDKELTGCFLAALESKSSLLGYLLAKKKIDALEAYSAAFLEEIYQNKYWGVDEAAANKQQQVKSMLIQIEEFLAA